MKSGQWPLNFGFEKVVQVLGVLRRRLSLSKTSGRGHAFAHFISLKVRVESEPIMYSNIKGEESNVCSFVIAVVQFQVLQA